MNNSFTIVQLQISPFFFYLLTVLSMRSEFQAQESAVLSCSSTTGNTQICTVTLITMATHHFYGSFYTLFSSCFTKHLSNPANKWPD